MRFHIKYLTLQAFCGSFLVLAALALAVSNCVQAADPVPTPGESVLAVVDGKAISAADVRRKAADAFTQIDRDYQRRRQDLLERTLDQVIDDLLLNQEATARRVSRDQLLATLKVAPVTDADVNVFYEQNKARIEGPKGAVAGQIRQFLEQRAHADARQKFLRELRAQHKVEIKLRPDRVAVAATGPAKGPAGAPVTIVEFSDFQCPYCAQLAPIVNRVKQSYGDRVRLVFRQYPLGSHPDAAKAAEASLCAADQGKFWEMHDALFADQHALGVDQLKARAKALGLNATSFNACLDSGARAAQVRTDASDGARAGITSTPTLFINGRLLSGAAPAERISALIDDELRRAGAH
jgi:protein-disulfide isomerase